MFKLTTLRLQQIELLMHNNIVTIYRSSSCNTLAKAVNTAKIISGYFQPLSTIFFNTFLDTLGKMYRRSSCTVLAKACK